METTPALTLVKDEKIDLTKTNPGLKLPAAGLGWDTSKGTGSYDLDAFAIPLKGGKLLTGEVLKGVAYFNHKKFAGCECGADNLTGEGDGDDETININLAEVAASGADEVLICVNIYEAKRKNQHFGQVQNAFVRIYDTETKKEITRFDLSEDYSAYNGMIMGKLYLRENEWKFQALGQGVNGDITEIASAYKQ